MVFRFRVLSTLETPAETLNKANKTDSHIKHRQFVKLIAVRLDRAKLPVYNVYLFIYYLLSSTVRFVFYLFMLRFENALITNRIMLEKNDPKHFSNNFYCIKKYN